MRLVKSKTSIGSVNQFRQINSESVVENSSASIDRLIEKANNSKIILEENVEESKQRSALLDLFMKVTAQGQQKNST